MRLSRFKVQNYKAIDDTDWVSADENVTALVGRNESGKTAILRALWKSNNVADVTFDKQLDFPRGRYSRERKGEQLVTAIEFALSEQEAAQLRAEFPVDLEAAPKVVTLSTFYKGEDEVRRAVSFEKAIKSRCHRGVEPAKDAIEAVASALARHTGAGDKTISDAKKSALAKMDAKYPIWWKANVTALQEFKAAVDAWVQGAPSDRQSLAAKARAQLENVVSEALKGDPAAAARKWVTDNLPVFIYFDDYGQLRTRIHLPTYLRLVKEQNLEPEVRTQRALFTWCGIDAQEILELGKPRNGEGAEDAHRRLDKRRTLLESASISLTGKWSDWWIPETRHKLHLSADGEYLVLNVSDPKTEYQIPFEERSHGFQWFFSFYLVFLVESEDDHKGAILLLDEPGLHLHPTLQSNLIELFDRISNGGNQLLYSTHLPFLIDGDRLNRVRMVHLDGSNPPKTVVSTDARAGGDRDTLFPLQAAIGYSIAQTLFLGRRSVIVEGITDYWLIKGLNDCLAALRRPSTLAEGTVLIPAGGTSKLMPLASIMFATSGVAGRRMLVVLDSDNEGRGARTRVDRELFREESRVLMVGDAIGQPEATIEDLLSRAVYAEAAGRAHDVEVTLSADEMGAPTNVAALTMHWERIGRGKFGADEKAATVLRLIDDWGKDLSRIAEPTLKRATDLLSAINSRFDAPS